MAVTISGTDGISTPPVVVQGSTSGGITLAAPAVAGTNTQTLVAATGTLAPLIAGTAVASTSGTSIDFTSIPSWVKRITVSLRGVSTSGTSIVQIQLGTSGGIETTGYAGSASFPGASTNFTSGFHLETQGSAAYVREAAYTFTNISGNNWMGTCSNGLSNQPVVFVCGGSKSLSGVLDRVRITTVNGTDTFDAGSINIMYE